MRMLGSTVLLLMLAVPAFAQEEGRKFEIGWNVLSYSRQESVNLYGGDLSFAAKVTPRMAVVADLAVHTTTDSGVDLTTNSYRFGPRFYLQRTKRISTFGEFLFGGTRITGKASTSVGGTSVTVCRKNQ